MGERDRGERDRGEQDMVNTGDGEKEVELDATWSFTFLLACYIYTLNCVLHNHILYVCMYVCMYVCKNHVYYVTDRQAYLHMNR